MEEEAINFRPSRLRAFCCGSIFIWSVVALAWLTDSTSDDFLVNMLIGQVLLAIFTRIKTPTHTAITDTSITQSYSDEKPIVIPLSSVDRERSLNLLPWYKLNYKIKSLSGQSLCLSRLSYSFSDINFIRYVIGLGPIYRSTRSEMLVQCIVGIASAVLFPWRFAPKSCVVLFALVAFELTTAQHGYPSTFDWLPPNDSIAFLIYLGSAWALLCYAISLFALLATVLEVTFSRLRVTLGR